MSTGKKVMIGIALWLGVAVVLFLVFGSEGKNEEFKPQNEFKLDPWIELKIGSLDMSFNKAVLYILLTCVLTIGSMTYIAKRMQEKPMRLPERPAGEVAERDVHHLGEPAKARRDELAEGHEMLLVVAVRRLAGWAG